MKVYVYEKEIDFKGKIFRICGRIIKIFFILLLIVTPFALFWLFPEIIKEVDDYWATLFSYSLTLLIISVFIFLKLSEKEGRGQNDKSTMVYNNSKEKKREEKENIKVINQYLKKQMQSGGFKGFYNSSNINLHRGEKIIFKTGKDDILLIGASRYGKLNGRGRIYINGKLCYDGYFKNGDRYGWGKRTITDENGNKIVLEGLFIKGNFREILSGDSSSVLDSLLNSLILIFYHGFRK